ncbi:uncharacterized protein LOC130202350 [Pseudoliparis swirei]|uniref:uncharacterized protein LOC130202350 n=1 Tax=Pseudoliparis swirei TaxID=2059687 RepID=UPI0024BE90F4|nr:uncharacterized protein LOC130202350 [Pseudoliparis swirei]
MAELRWIKASWFLVLVLQFTAAATGQHYLSFTVRDGDEVSLPCFNVMDDHKNCNSTVWIFDDFKSPVAVFLVKDGQIDAEAKDKSDRLSVSENCSLVIKKVTDEDVGHYACIQYRSGHQQVQDALVILSVVTMTEHKDSEEVTLICSVSTYRTLCRHRVKWLIQGPDIINTTTSQSPCSANLSFSASHFLPMISELLQCEVTDSTTGEVEVFPFSPPPSSGEDPTTTTTTTVWSVLDCCMLVLRLAELLLVTVVVVLLVRAGGNRRPRDPNTVPGDGGGHEGAVNYENVGGPSVSVRLP